MWVKTHRGKLVNLAKVLLIEVHGDDPDKPHDILATFDDNSITTLGEFPCKRAAERELDKLHTAIAFGAPTHTFPAPAPVPEAVQEAAVAS